MYNLPHHPLLPFPLPRSFPPEYTGPLTYYITYLCLELIVHYLPLPTRLQNLSQYLFSD